MSIKCPGLNLTLQLYLCNNVHQMSRASTWHYNYIYATMSINCSVHVPDNITIFRPQCPSNVQGIDLTILLYFGNNGHQMSRACTWHYHYISNNVHQMSRACTLAILQSREVCSKSTLIKTITFSSKHITGSY